MMPVLGDDRLMYYPVEPVFEPDPITGKLKEKGKRIFCLPVCDFESEYYIFIATVELIKKYLGTKYAAVKVAKETKAERDLWSLPANGPSQGKTRK